MCKRIGVGRRITEPLLCGEREVQRLTDWLVREIKKISMIEKYAIPSRNNYSKLDANENLVLDKDILTKISIDSLKKIDLRKYPIELSEEVYKKISSYLMVSKKSLVLGSGSDQIIELLLTIIGKGRRLTSIYPTFSYFKTRCQLHKVGFSEILLSTVDNSINMEKFMEKARKSHAIYLCSPNNPTGNQFDKSQVLDILNSLENSLVIIDEAYVEFAKYSLTKYVQEYSNLVILRTFSKAMGLAGARIGYMIANEELADLFKNKIQLPYAVNSISIAIAISVLANPKKMEKSISLIKDERERLYRNLSKIKKIKVYKSDANFLFIKCNEKYKGILEALEDSKIIVKALGNIRNYGNCIRLTIGTKRMNDKILSIFNNIQ
ncbi:MAG: histidinol-phosphate transaminase [Thaumarchaeota archaeon]|nr:MAG: histidinol-phosphate transaminase [Nitrososphaerota archaeon]TLX90706.1 MAG: histidinol-phosphate transaminase [Nitrososphaerota archaeon]